MKPGGWRDFEPCTLCGAGPAQPCVSLASLPRYHTEIHNPHKGRINAGSDQTPPPPAPSECTSIHPYTRIQCQLGLPHDPGTHAAYDGMPWIWHTEET